MTTAAAQTVQPGNGATTSLSDTIGITVPSAQSVSAFAAQHTGNGNALDAGKTMAYAFRRTTTGGATTTLATITLAADGGTVRGQSTFAVVALLAGEVLTVIGTPSALLTAAVTDIMASAGGAAAATIVRYDYVAAVDLTLPNSATPVNLANATNVTAGYVLPTIASTTTAGRAQITKTLGATLTSGAGSAFYQVRLTAPDASVLYGVWSSSNISFDDFALTQIGTYTVAIFYFMTSSGVFACNASSAAPGSTASLVSNWLRMGGPIFST